MAMSATDSHARFGRDSLRDHVSLHWYIEKSFLPNLASIDINYGPTFSDVDDVYFRKEFAGSHRINIAYGFSRFQDSELSHDYVYYAGERMMFSNNSSHLGLQAEDIDNILTDSWLFGFSYSNGYAYVDNETPWLILYHTGAIMWRHTDVETFSIHEYDNKRLDSYDEQFRFASSYQSGVMYHLGGVVYLNAMYENIMLSPDFKMSKYLPCTLAELIVQRAIDLYGFKLLGRNRIIYPVTNFLAKSLVSTAFYLFRARDQFWPYSSAAPLMNYQFRIGFSLLI